MRRAKDSEILYGESGEIFGINLGADWCAEHEWGIKEIKQLFNLDNSKNGVEKRLQRVVPDALVELTFTKDKNKYFAIIVNSSVKNMVGLTSKNEKNFLKNKVLFSVGIPYADNLLSTAWDSKSFGICVRYENKNILDDFISAYKNTDLVIGIGASGGFQNGGLTFCYNSRLPQEVRDIILKEDLSHEKLLKVSLVDTKIEKILRDKKCEYLALSPNWKNDERTEFHYWLNPINGNKNNYGWFSLEELILWSKGKGPIPK